ncbi:MAG: hypothetical protein ACE5WD_07880 [Candidatus Aminicenantia bacterium]
MDKKEFTVLIKPIIKSKKPRILAKNERAVPTLKTVEIAFKIFLKEGLCPKRFWLSDITLWPAEKNKGIYQTFKPISIEGLNKDSPIETESLKMNFQYPGVWWIDITVDAGEEYDIKTKQIQLTGEEGDGWPQNEENPKTNICRNPISAHDLYFLTQLKWIRWTLFVGVITLVISVLTNFILHIVN